MESGYRRVKARMQPGDMRSHRIIQLNSLNRHELELLGKNKDKSVFEHPAYPIPVCAVGAEYDWTLDVSNEAYMERRGLFRTAFETIPNKFCVCSSCLKAKCMPWNSQRDAFTQGSAIRFYGIKDQEELLQIIDEAMQNQTLSFQKTSYNHLSMMLECVELDEDPDFLRLDRNRPRQPTERCITIPITDIYSLTFLANSQRNADDNPHFFILLVAIEKQNTVCHVMVTHFAELAVHIVETLEAIIQHLYTEAVISSLDDNISAGIDGRPTLEKQAQLARTPSSNRNHQQSIEERHSPDSANIEPSGDLSDDSSIDLASLKNVNGVVSDERISQAQGSTRGKTNLVDISGSFKTFGKDRLSVFNIFGDKGRSSLPAKASRTETQFDPTTRPSFANIVAFEETFVSNGLDQPAPVRETQSSDKPEPKTGGNVGSEAKEYMQNLRSVFTQTEISTFVKILRTYRATRDFQDFTNQMLELFGPQRQQRLPGLQAFLRGQERDEFRHFLREHDLS
eukprot:gene9391-1640_t